jgi:hypothetical protein
LSVSGEGGLDGFVFMIIYGLWNRISVENDVKPGRFIFAFALSLIFYTGKASVTLL